jgi:predicted DNA-binding transcriptional regulator AlpA
MNRPAPLFADERSAADLFCMKPKEFRRLVEDGHLPPPRDLGGLERWDVEELRMIARGEAMDGGGLTW